ncbi:aromatic/alkene monooxygenase hydroxylase subunit beta [Azovibrio restrictus]|uniref:aromatic/alkene monooxygenase hydroxylase subunit beta n=1 Tax=Azovibrio restrictus TaxID=146938 RepID=UPI0003FEB864|nr:aromatic/alkene monooxygenase hydroxylase subunit beta [Azovibrio restrictus]MCE1172465.1 aromatic/alkene monooxygenase hydroxylase subunit beta [Azovibrio sp.]MDD3483841.1 aromatic/alkene monooxygenase hydroxylase subunit beta [Azovibrio restrictus]
MQMDLRTVAIKPLRQTFDHVARRLGADKPASRYQEGTLDLQMETNFHYRPLWAPEFEIFDKRRTAIVMADWYAFKDPRQFYYGTYTLARAKLQETAEGDFQFVEERGLAELLPDELRQLAMEMLLPLRHVAWGSNMNNCTMSDYGYGTAITQPCLYQAMDQLGIAQYISRLGLLLGEPEDLDAAKAAWLQAPEWQGLRRYVEDTLVLQDWFELFVAQNLVLDGLLYPLVYEHFDRFLACRGGPTLSMLTRFQNEWFAESSRWVDSCIKVAAGESAANRERLEAWCGHWLERAQEALTPLAARVFTDGAGEVMAEILEQFRQRLTKAGVGGGQ